MEELIAEPLKGTPEPSIPREKSPFAGFLPRLGAFMIDAAVLYFVARQLNKSVRPALLSFNPLLPWLGHALVFLYFFIGNGPWSQGRTLGKMLMQLQVVGADGQHLSHRASLRRALIEMCVFFLFCMNTPYYALVFPPEARFAATALLSLTSLLALTLLIAQSFGIAMHPRKRSLHDLWADSYVTRNPLPENFLETLAAEPDPITAQRIKMSLKWTIIFWIVASIALLLRPAKELMNAEVRQRFQDIARLQAANPAAPYALELVEFPGEPDRAAFADLVRQVRERARVKGTAIPTTESLRARVVADGEGIAAQLFRRRGAFSLVDLARPEFRAGMESLRRDLWNEWRARKKPGAIQARHFDALLVEPLQVLAYHETLPRARIHGPADPALGKLIYEEFNLPEPEAGQTTSTTPAARQNNEPIPR